MPTPPPPERNLYNVRRHFGCQTREGLLAHGGEARDAAEQPARHRSVPQQRMTAPKVSAASGWGEAAPPTDDHGPKLPYAEELDT